MPDAPPTSTDPHLIARSHHTESDKVREVWEELHRMSLPRIDHMDMLYARWPDALQAIRELRACCSRPPPDGFDFSRIFAYRLTEEWFVEPGRLAIDADKAGSLPLYWKIKELFGEHSRLSGFFYYPPGGFKEWHTDFEAPHVDTELHWRIYLVKTEDGTRSWFQYQDPRTAEIRRVHDEDGCLNFFSLREDRPLWHSV